MSVVSSVSAASSPPHGTPQVPSFRAEELLNPQEEEQCTLRRKLFQTFEEAAPTVRAAPGWRTSMSSGPGDGDDGKLEAAQEMSRLRSQLQEERSVTRRLVAERNTLRSQVCKVQSDLQAFRDKHEKTMMGMEVMCVQLGIAKQKEVRAERMEASLKTLQEVSQQLEANPPQGRPDAAFEALRLGLSSVLSDAKQCNEKGPAAWTPEGRQMTQMTQMTPQKTAQALASLAKPHWDGQYLSSPPKIQEGNSSTPSARSGDAEGESEGEGDLLPPPPNSKCWEWPLSKPEKQERVAMIDAQLWRYEQTGLIEQVEMLQGLCAKHGITPSFEDDEVGSTASSESV